MAFPIKADACQADMGDCTVGFIKKTRHGLQICDAKSPFEPDYSKCVDIQYEKKLEPHAYAMKLGQKQEMSVESKITLTNKADDFQISSVNNGKRPIVSAKTLNCGDFKIENPRAGEAEAHPGGVKK